MADKATGRWVNGEWIPSVEGSAHDETGALAVDEAQKKARKAITAKDAPSGRPSPPDTTGMSLVQAAAANTAYKKKLAAWEASKRTPGAQASAIE